MTVIERCARALYEQAGKEWLKAYPWESDDPIAKDARERAIEQANVVLNAADWRGAVEERDETFALLSEMYEQSGAGGDLAERVSRFLAAHEDEWGQ